MTEKDNGSNYDLIKELRKKIAAQFTPTADEIAERILSDEALEAWMIAHTAICREAMQGINEKTSSSLPSRRTLVALAQMIGFDEARRLRFEGVDLEDKDSVMEFVYQFDAYLGAAHVAGLILAADGVLAKDEEVKLRGSFVPNYLELIREDPTGFSAVNAQVERLTRNFRDVFIGEDYQIPDFVVRGAEQFQRVYKIIYPMTEGLL